MYQAETCEEKHVPSKLQKAATKHNMPFSPSSNKAKNVKMVVQCEECLKWQVFYAACSLKSRQRLELEKNLDVLSDSCGESFCDVEDKEDSVFEYIFVNNKLTCDSPIEVSYYAVFNDPLCYYCGSEHDLPVVPTNDVLPLCDEWKAPGKSARAKSSRQFKEKS